MSSKHVSVTSCTNCSQTLWCCLQVDVPRFLQQVSSVAEEVGHDVSRQEAGVQKPAGDADQGDKTLFTQLPENKASCSVWCEINKPFHSYEIIESLQMFSWKRRHVTSLHQLSCRVSGAGHVPVRKDKDLLPGGSGGVPGEDPGR